MDRARASVARSPLRWDGKAAAARATAAGGGLQTEGRQGDGGGRKRDEDPRGGGGGHGQFLITFFAVCLRFQCARRYLMKILDLFPIPISNPFNVGFNNICYIQSSIYWN